MSARRCRRSRRPNRSPGRPAGWPSATGSTDEGLRRWLAESGFHASTSVQLPGEFSQPAASWIFSRPTSRRRFGSSFLTTKSNRSGVSTRLASGVSKHCRWSIWPRSAAGASGSGRWPITCPLTQSFGSRSGRVQKVGRFVDPPARRHQPIRRFRIAVRSFGHLRIATAATLAKRPATRRSICGRRRSSRLSGRSTKPAKGSIRSRPGTTCLSSATRRPMANG
jgi:hypothetical protein